MRWNHQEINTLSFLDGNLLSDDCSITKSRAGSSTHTLDGRQIDFDFLNPGEGFGYDFKCESPRRDCSISARAPGIKTRRAGP